MSTNRSNSHADGAGSIPVTRSHMKLGVRAVMAAAGLTIKIHLRLRVPAACPMRCQGRLAAAPNEPLVDPMRWMRYSSLAAVAVGFNSSRGEDYDC